MSDPAPVHVRTRAAAAALAAGVPSVAGRVFPGRVAPITEAELPALLVYSTEESVQVAAIGRGARQERQVGLTVFVAVAEIEGGDDAADALALEVEGCLLAQGALAAVAPRASPCTARARSKRAPARCR